MAGNSDTHHNAETPRNDVARYPLFAVVAVVLASYLANFDSRLTSVGLADLRGAFSLGFDEGAWLSTAAIGSQILIAPAVAWLASALGLRRVLGVPSLLFAVVSFAIPFVQNYPTLITLSVLHGLLLGTFVPATLMIVFRNLPIRWWLPVISIYAFRVGVALDTSTSLVGFYVDKLGWQWVYWQGAVVAPLMGLMVYLGTPRQPIDRELLRNADWGGMLLLGTAVAATYAGLDQGNRLDWLENGTVVALLSAGAFLFVAFLINEAVVREPWANVNVLFSRNVGLSCLLILLYTLASLANASLVPNFLGTIDAMRPEQSGVLLAMYSGLPLIAMLPVAIVMLRNFDARFVVVIGFASFAIANLWGTHLTHDWAREDFIGIAMLLAVGQALTLLPAIILTISNADPNRATAFAAYIQILRLGGSEIGVALMGTWIRVREQIHSNYLGLDIESGSANIVRTLRELAARFASHGIGSSQGRAIGTLAGVVEREANVLAYIDGFVLCFWLSIAGLLVVTLITRAPPGPFTPLPFHLVKAFLRKWNAAWNPL